MADAVVSGGASTPAPRRVLALGVYLADREHLAAEVAAELGRSGRWDVEQRWIALGSGPVPEALAAVTVERVAGPAPKFALVNRLLRGAPPAGVDYLLVTDDDIALPPGFLDRYLGLVERHRLALAQPARSHDSSLDLGFVEQLDGLDARWTRYVEIGPLFSIHREAFPHLLPFDETPAMGWGLDFTWPVTLERAGLRLGVVDATPVRHALRKQAAFYSGRDALDAMTRYLASRPHLGRSEAFTIVEGYAEREA
jgi:hypothetical protein